MLCAVFGCNNCNRRKEDTVYIGFHIFPKCANLRKKWINFCRRKDNFNWKTARICSLHFSSDDFENNLQFQMGKSILKNCVFY